MDSVPCGEGGKLGGKKEKKKKIKLIVQTLLKKRRHFEGEKKRAGLSFAVLSQRINKGLKKKRSTCSIRGGTQKKKKTWFCDCLVQNFASMRRKRSGKGEKKI